ncbi:hypothetical protein LX32DRAFT_206355 [Colletotrichum zoysiae]|uniref:Uncharacterized protein n=1 Tax=Colletotrichum zoysiae TaxID=1216348 RepID=A0AAD9H4S0_9PEZI|nr:hypothetical protein LX32DRAFT_206355 [Colletotrichum zoysiae]
MAIYSNKRSLTTGSWRRVLEWQPCSTSLAALLRLIFPLTSYVSTLTHRTRQASTIPPEGGGGRESFFFRQSKGQGCPAVQALDERWSFFEYHGLAPGPSSKMKRRGGGRRQCCTLGMGTAHTATQEPRSLS